MPPTTSARLPRGMRSSFFTLVRHERRGSRDALHLCTIRRSAARTTEDAGQCREGGRLSGGMEGGQGGAEWLEALATARAGCTCSLQMQFK
jgi:hypothetical protein